MFGFSNNLSQLDFAAVRNDVAEQGWSLLGAPIASEALEPVRAEIDELAKAATTEVHYNDSEHRIWHAHKKNDFIKNFGQYSDEIISSIVRKKSVAHDVLAIRNRPIDAASAHLAQGRWHLDSFNRQLKVFMFLNDVSERSGALEIISKSQKFGFKARYLLKGELITLKDMLNGVRAYAKLKENLVQRVIASGYESNLFSVPRGTLAVVDTSAIHRASPCIEGERYALTSYYR